MTSTYVTLARTPGWGAWAGSTIGARLPVAMAPLAMVLAGHQVSGGYALGGVLVTAHTLGEALAAPAAGAALDRWSHRRVLALCLATEAALFAALAVLVAAASGPEAAGAGDAASGVGPPGAGAAASGASGSVIVALVVLAALAGAIPAGAPGGLRSALAGIVAAPVLPRALSVDSVINQACWGVAPVLVAVTATAASPALAVALVAIPPALGAVASVAMPEPDRAGPATAARARGDLAALLRLLARTLALTVVLRFVLGALTVIAAPLFDAAGSTSLAGVALGAYAAGTGLGALAYGARDSWPGTHERQADAALAALGLVVALALFLHGAPAFLLLYAVAGTLEGPVNLARSLHLQAILPPTRRATGFSLQYAAIGWGFAAGGLLPSQLLGHATPQAILAVTGTVVAAAACTALATRHRV